MIKRFAPLVFMCLLVPLFIYPQTEARYRIDSVEYNITGSTREHPLRRAVEIDKKRIFANQQALELYVEDLRLQLNNLRVLENSSVDMVYGSQNDDGIIPVQLVVKTEDTVNIIALPKPGFDSNSGFELKIKMKNYNFFGSMQELNADIEYEYDENDNQSVAGGFSFSIPFEAYGYAFIWDLSTSLTVPFDNRPIYDFNTGIQMEIPVSSLKINVGFTQGISVNNRDADKAYYEDDWLYYTESLFMNVPITLYRYGTNGEIVWSPMVFFSVNWDSDGIQADDLKGPTLSLGHALTAGRINWIGNFRRGYTVSAGNNYIINYHEDKDLIINITGLLQGHYSFFDRIGISTRLSGYYNFFNYLSEKQGGKIRGILDKRIDADYAVFYNLDIPIRVLRVNFKEMSGIDWTEYISFEMHFSPFFDMALAHNRDTEDTFTFKDGWYAGGLEVIVYPLKMRSIYARASVGFDLAAVLESGKLSGRAERDGASIRELFIGIGLAY